MLAVAKMKNGCILCGGVGSGKSRTALAYYYILHGGKIGKNYIKMNGPPDLYIITTARKRDTKEWEDELTPFHLLDGTYNNKVIVDSWNNLHKYTDITNKYVIFDEQRVIGRGSWVKSFLKIAKHNQWILLSATPGDTWQDYVPVFIANGFYKNRTEFNYTHCVFSRFSKYPKIEKYISTGILEKHRRDILVDMDFKRETTRHDIDICTEYDTILYRNIMRNRWNYRKDKPLINAAELCYELRWVVNANSSRMTKLYEILISHPKAIIFYNFDYELDILRGMNYPEGTEIAEYNGHKHENIPSGDRWVFLVQYSSGSEGWNCVLTDTVIFWSLNYSYRIMEQARGRIDRMNTSYKDLYYYYLKSMAPIDIAILKAIKNKKLFNEKKFTGW